MEVLTSDTGYLFPNSAVVSIVNERLKLIHDTACFNASCSRKHPSAIWKIQKYLYSSYERLEDEIARKIALTAYKRFYEMLQENGVEKFDREDYVEDLKMY